MNTTKVLVIGQGYVGLPLSLACVKAGFHVTGVDIDALKIDQIASGVSPVADVSNSEIHNALATQKFHLKTAIEFDSTTQIICVCVPTPLGPDKQPDLRILESVTQDVSRFLKPGMLVIVESTVQPGTTRGLVLPILEKGSGIVSDQFFLAFSPERVDPSNKSWSIKNTPKLVSGLTPVALKKANDFYSQFIDDVINCKTLEIAETSKLLENSFRFINISFINELSIFCHKLGIDVNEVINVASTKPYGFMPFYPSIGVGGHCIPVDPLYLSDTAHEMGVPIRLIDLADQINRELPAYFVGRAEEKLNGLKNKKVLVVGVAYKPNVADIRETPATALILGLRNRGAQVFWHDDLIKDWNGEKSIELHEGFDLAVIATLHSYIDLAKLGATPILDTRGSI